MKYIYIIILSVLAFTSCKTKKKAAEVIKVEEKIEVTEFSYTDADMVASIERTACFGVCPVYKMEVYGNGKIVYEGMLNVKNIGKYTGQTTKENIDKLLSSAKEIGYADLNDAYDSKLVTDLPSSTTVVLLDGVAKKVYARYGTPDKVLIFQKYFDTLFKDVEYTEVK